MSKTKLYRFFEILPGFAMWLMFIGPIILSFYYPRFVVGLFIVYAIYWLGKSFVMSGHLIAGYLVYKHDISQDWLKLIKQDFKDQYFDIVHLVIIATYKEDLLTLKQSMEALKESKYDLKKIFVVLATEERDHERGVANASALDKEFGNIFAAFWSFEHPKNISGEVIGKGGNIYYSAKQATNKLRDLNIEPKNVLVTTLDADHRVDKKYFACLTYRYLNTPKEERIYKSYQPLPMFFNNIWEVPIPMRIIALGSSFWQMIESTRTHRLRNFASHAQPLEGLIKTDFWSRETIVEDGHQFWRSWFAFGGKHSVIPINIPIYQDAVLSNSFMDTVKQQYLQKRRWAWGVSDFPYVVTECFKHPEIPLGKKLVKIFNIFEGNFSWSTGAIILAFIAWIPYWLRADSSDIFLYNFPLFYSRILTLAAIGMIVTLTIATLIVPPIPKNNKLGRWKLVIEWIMTPLLITFVNIVFGAFPAVDSQTRLMFGKYLNVFNVTPKKSIEIPKERHV